MANYLLLFHGGSGMAATPEEGQKVMAAWTAWFGQLGDHLVDGGNPITQAKVIDPSGDVRAPDHQPTGYTILKADSLDEAVTLSKGCPVLAGGARVTVCETMAVM